MLTGVIVSLLALALIVFLIIYKKEMIVKMFTLNMSSSANEFTQQLEQTADVIIKRLEDEAGQLEFLLEEAESKIGMLSQQVEHANKIIKHLTELENQRIEQQYDSHSDTAVIDNISVKNVSDDVYPDPTQTDNELSTHSDNNDNKFSSQEPINMEKHQLILAMADQGYNVTEIAKAVGMGKGEVMLLLQLNKK
ncbi:DUF6115 domain-containing protein [Sporomusa acidovorans]|uniref:Uncharacterized protein n=1 Tax=Sporomusa acidovorans (strain ATCC 49682 / DSM 3132 / Mol) TaxID=1123286 RepID=A0ABZ3J3W9_SPOA4|nr:hypothetical protein [Sporomusa acidovorans]OZC20093.1 hypothetical protein SPACI_24910 [Sporomusa acidovorans DSM 3132]SDD45443.1 hypothetical protein SAMN04488499_1001298 [Sporomusa acidovorans]